MSASSLSVRVIAGLHVWSAGANMAEAVRAMKRAERQRKAEQAARVPDRFSVERLMGPSTPSLAEAYPKAARTKLASAGLNIVLGIALNIAATKLARR